MLKIGDRAPSFTLLSDEGEKVSLKDFKGQTVILYFYPKDLTPGCTQQACDFSMSAAALKKRKVAVLGVSKDSVASHVKFRDKHKLSFPLLADVEGKACESYGVWQQKSLYGRKFMGIVRTTFVIDPAGKITAIYDKVKVNGHVARVLDDLKK